MNNVDESHPAAQAAARDRLIKLLGMLGSAHAGERAAAALKVTEWLRSHNTTWHDLLAPQPVTVTVAPAGTHESWQAVARSILADYGFVLRNGREAEFLEGRLRYPHLPLSAKQEIWLRDIAGRAGLSW